MYSGIKQLGKWMANGEEGLRNKQEKKARMIHAVMEQSWKYQNELIKSAVS